MTALVAANYLVCIMSLAFDDLTNMKLNKLLYFAQGYYLQMYHKPLFSDEIEAWSHGPVVPAVYSKYKEYGDKPISSYDMSMTDMVSEDAASLLFDIARTYGKFTASALRNMTHVVGSPWDQVYSKGSSHIIIPVKLIEQYFMDLQPLKPAERVFKESDFIGYWDSDGVLVLPKEWDDDDG